MAGLANIIWYVVFSIATIVFTLGFGLPFVILWTLLVFLGADGRAKKAGEIIDGVLMPGETLIAQALQHRALALQTRRQVIAITSSRIILIKRGLFGGFRMFDTQWKDLTRVTIAENTWSSVCGSNLTFVNVASALFSFYIPGVPNETARFIYSKAQAEEQNWEEKRRIRTIEEVKAAAGGLTVNNNTAGPAAPPGDNRMVADIQQAKALFDAGTISDAEFQEMKSRILSGTR